MAKKIAVIGSGVGGMAAAIRLQCRGYDVTLYEKNDTLGGKISEIQLGKFRFDTGPSLFTLPHLVDELILLNEKFNIIDFSYQKLDKVTKYFYENDTFISNDNPHNWDLFSPNNKNRIVNYLQKNKLRYELAAPIFLQNSLHSIHTYFSKYAWNALLKLHSLGIFQTMHEENMSNFDDMRIVQLFDRYATYNGSDPYRTPATLNIISHLEHNLGAYYPTQGMIAIRNAMSEMIKICGVVCSTGAEVSQILVNNNKVKGLIVNNIHYEYDYVVSNADICHTYRKLLPTIKAPERILAQPKSSSAMIFHWGVQGTHPDLELHNILFTDNYKSEFEHIRQGNIYSKPTIYIYISSKVKKDDAPAGCENWFVMINVPHDQGQDWHMLAQNAKENVVKIINKRLNINIEDRIIAEQIRTPLHIAQETGAYLGALYGNSSNNMFSAFLRHANYSTDIKGLYFCGGSVHPGGGIPLCLYSAQIVDKLIWSYDKSKS
ncbi:MAG: 1-hydroxycarotenoid 3,4-desaturase CrtD [Cytophagales bacterium]|nr:1-hydroxycarotenoid 3,4-desaturase CrtD [Cytophagales bacterium]